MHACFNACLCECLQSLFIHLDLYIQIHILLMNVSHAQGVITVLKTLEPGYDGVSFGCLNSFRPKVVERVMQCVAVCCSVLQCVAVCCSVLQCAAACCSVL